MHAKELSTFTTATKIGGGGAQSTYLGNIWNSDDVGNFDDVREWDDDRNQTIQVSQLPAWWDSTICGISS